MRRAVLALAVLLTLTAVVHGAPNRNVVLLVADDLGLDLGCYGSKVIKTPHLDALAKQGTRFTHGFATVASCSASRAVIYTGQFTHTNGQFGHAHLPADLQTHANIKSLPKALKEAGYRTGIVGKLHVQPASVYPWDVDLSGGPVAHRDVAKMAEEAGKFIAESGDKPFLLVVGFGDPHRAGQGFGNDKKYPGVEEVKYDPKDMKVPYFLPDIPEAREELAEYAQAASRLDQGVGMVLDRIKKAGKADSTLVIFVSDNGIPFPGAKTTLYDSGLRLPFIVSAPGQKKTDVACNAMVSFVDIMPTALDWAGVKAPPLPGRSVLPILEEENPRGWDVVYGSHVFHEITMYYPMRMIRTRQHKLILNIAHKLDYPFASDLYGSKTWQAILKQDGKMLGERTIEAYVHRPLEELYDLEKDPKELKNVAGDKEYAEVLASLRAQLKDWQQKTKDPWLSKYRYE